MSIDERIERGVLWDTIISLVYRTHTPIHFERCGNNFKVRIGDEEYDYYPDKSGLPVDALQGILEDFMKWRRK